MNAESLASIQESVALPEIPRYILARTLLGCRERFFLSVGMREAFAVY